MKNRLQEENKENGGAGIKDIAWGYHSSTKNASIPKPPTAENSQPQEGSQHFEYKLAINAGLKKLSANNMGSFQKLLLKITEKNISSLA